jgi:hypothetical protein
MAIVRSLRCCTGPFGWSTTKRIERILRRGAEGSCGNSQSAVWGPRANDRALLRAGACGGVGEMGHKLAKRRQEVQISS